MEDFPLYSIDDVAEHTAIQFGYLYILGRNPENVSVIESGASAGLTIKQTREALLACSEYRGKRLIESLAINFKTQLDELPLRAEQGHATDEVIVLQTSDASRYFEMLTIGVKHHEQWARARGLDYRAFVGIKRGAYPHHATYNRTHLLWELVQARFQGWVLYLDADVLITSLDFDLKGHLDALRRQGKCMLLHTVYDNTSPNYNWWDINAGAFAIDLSNATARLIIQLWSHIYREMVSDDDYKRATQWEDIINDQTSLSAILQLIANQLKDTEAFQLCQFQHEWATQVLRSFPTGISSTEELVQRTERLRELSNKIIS